MPRPARYANKEGRDPLNTQLEADERRTQLVKQPRPGETPPEDVSSRRGAVRDDEPLDGGGRSRQSSDQGQASEGELELARTVASRAGWVPLDKWTRRPEDWIDADVYLERMPRELERARERAKRTGSIADAAQDAARQAARIEAEQGVRAAVDAGDADAAIEAARRVGANSGADPRTVAWVAKNRWFDSDPVAKAAAVAEARRRASLGESVEDQLEGSESLIRNLFPDHFPETRRERQDREDNRDSRERDDRPNDRETRLSDYRPTREAPDVHGGSRGGGRPRAGKQEPGWNDIPADERAQLARFVTRFERRGMKRPDAERQLGVEYWRNKGTQV
jgi:hypothetical protein